MTIAVTCPGCDVKLKAKEELLGKRVKCPKCGHAVDVEDETPLTLEPFPEESLEFGTTLHKLPPAPKRTFAPEPAIPVKKKAKRSAEAGEMTPVVHMLCGWQFVFLFLGGLLGGGLGGIAYAINVAIVKTRLPLPAKIVSVIAVGIGAIIAYFVVIVLLHNALRR